MHEWNLLRGKTNDYPIYEEIREFMTLRIRGLTDHFKPKYETSNNRIKTSTRASVSNVTTEKCVACASTHRLFQCEDFKRKSVDDRTQICKTNKCCFNCLRVGHLPYNCASSKCCNICRRTHHTLLHRSAATPAPNAEEHSGSKNKLTSLAQSNPATAQVSESVAVAV